MCCLQLWSSFLKYRTALNMFAHFYGVAGLNQNVDVNNTLKSVLQLESVRLTEIPCIRLIFVRFNPVSYLPNGAKSILLLLLFFPIRLVCKYQRLNVKGNSKKQTVQVGASQKTLNFQTFLLNKSLFGYKQWFTGGRIHYPHVGVFPDCGKS